MRPSKFYFHICLGEKEILSIHYLVNAQKRSKKQKEGIEQFIDSYGNYKCSVCPPFTHNKKSPFPPEICNILHTTFDVNCDDYVPCVECTQFGRPCNTL